MKESQRRMKVLILVDFLNDWALHNRAKAIEKFSPKRNRITIAEAFKSRDWLHSRSKFDIFHFNFTDKLTDYYDFILNNKDRCLITLVNERSLGNGFGVDQDRLKHLVNTCPYVTSVSQTQALEYKHTYIPNGLDESIFDLHKTPVVGYAGSIKANKGIDYVIAACEQLNLTLKTARYNHNKPDYPHHDMKLFYNSLDVYVHASHTEGFNNTIIEALSCNVPVLMTRQGCWQEFIGWVDFIEPTIESVTNSLKRYCGRELILDKFLWSEIAPKYHKLYETIYARL